MAVVIPQAGEAEHTDEAPRTVALQMAQVTPGDLEWINAAVDRWQGSLRWSIAGRAPSLADVEARMWAGVEAQRAVWHPDFGPVALLQLVDVDLHNEVAGLGLLVAPSMIGSFQPAVAAFVDGMAIDRPLRKLMFGCVSGGLPVEELFQGRAVHVGCHVQQERATDGSFDDVDLYEVWCRTGGDR